MKGKQVYWLVNTGCLAAAFACFGFAIAGTPDFTLLDSFFSCLILALTALLVYGLKSLRLYIILAGSGISLRNHIREFCKTALVSIFIPFKLGDIFRAYCYGYQIHQYARGILAVLLDRFADTLGLVTLLVFVSFAQEIPFGVLLYLLCVFMVFLILIYRLFPDFYTYWNRYLVGERATRNRLHYLAFLYFLHKLYEDCRTLVHGRVMGLYIISLAAWSVEMGGVALAALSMSRLLDRSFLTVYLSSALGLGESLFQRWFLAFSCIVLLAGLVLSYGWKWWGRRRQV